MDTPLAITVLLPTGCGKVEVDASGKPVNYANQLAKLDEIEKVRSGEESRRAVREAETNHQLAVQRANDSLSACFQIFASVADIQKGTDVGIARSLAEKCGKDYDRVTDLLAQDQPGDDVAKERFRSHRGDDSEREAAALAALGEYRAERLRKLTQNSTSMDLSRPTTILPPSATAPAPPAAIVVPIPVPVPVPVDPPLRAPDRTERATNI